MSGNREEQPCLIVDKIIENGVRYNVVVFPKLKRKMFVDAPAKLSDIELSKYCKKYGVLDLIGEN